MFIKRLCVYILLLSVLGAVPVLGEVEVPEEPHPFMDAQILDNAFNYGADGNPQSVKKEQISIVLAVFKKYVTNDVLKKQHQELIDQFKKKSANSKIFKDNLEAYKKLIGEEPGFKKNGFLNNHLKALITSLDLVEKAMPESVVRGAKTVTNLAAQEDFKTKAVASSSPPAFLSPAVAVDALGSLIAKRFKEELTIAFLNKFRNKLDSSPYGDLFPSVKTFLKSSGIFNFKIFLPTLKEAFHKDLNQLDANLKIFLKNHVKKMEKDALSLLDDEGIHNALTVKLSKIKTLLDKEKSNVSLAVLWQDYHVDIVVELANLFVSEDFKNGVGKALDTQISNLVKKKRSQFISDGETDILEKLRQKKSNINAITKWSTSNGINKNRKLIHLAIAFLDFMGKVKNGSHPKDLIDQLNTLDGIDQIDSKLSSPIRLLALISRNLRNKKKDGWLTSNDFKTLFDTNNFMRLKLFAGLVYSREIHEIQIIKIGDKSLQAIIDNAKKDFDEVKDYITKSLDYYGAIYSKITEIKTILNEIKQIEAKGEKVGYERFHLYLTKAFEIIEVGVDINALTGKANLDAKMERYLGYARKLLEISRHIYDKAYGAALVNALELIQNAFPEDSPIKQGLVKYVSLAISFVNAKDAKELQSVLESVALPVGSYRLKRASIFNVSLNAYAGAFGGGELLAVDKEAILDDTNASWNVGFAAPIGLAFS